VTFLCDTNIISELARPQPNPGVLAWSAQVSAISLSVITLEEIAYGLASKPNARVQNWFQEFLKTYCQIIPITAEIAHHSGELRGGLRTQGKPRTASQFLMVVSVTPSASANCFWVRNCRTLSLISGDRSDFFIHY
jgi:predicted nucleic acid-binding protein